MTAEQIPIVHVDEDLVVVDKPASIPVSRPHSRHHCHIAVDHSCPSSTFHLTIPCCSRYFFFFSIGILFEVKNDSILHYKCPKIFILAKNINDQTGQ